MTALRQRCMTLGDRNFTLDCARCGQLVKLGQWYVAYGKYGQRIGRTRYPEIMHAECYDALLKSTAPYRHILGGAK